MTTAGKGAVKQAPKPRRPARAGHEPEPDLTDTRFYINRELSWLEFNQRVLLQALDAAHPLLERVKFLSIVATNLDEFFMVRVATLLRKFRAASGDVSPDGLDTGQQLDAIRERAAQMMRDMSSCWTTVLQPALAEHDIRFLERSAYTDAVRAYLRTYFRRNIHPVLTPLAFDPGHPFPYISNLSMNLAVVVSHGGRTRFARVKLPDVLPRFIPLPAQLAGAAGDTFVFLEDVVREQIGTLFPGATLRGAHLFRIVRDTDMVIQEDEADDLLESVDKTLKELRYGALSQLVVEATMPDRVLNILLENFEIEESVVERTSSRMGYGHWLALTGLLHRPKLKDAPFLPRGLWSNADRDAIFDEVRERDHLVHHPFDSFASVEAFLRAAVEDPQVIAIKLTLYRIGSNSPLVDLLIEAAEAGKQVAVLVELKARFDERNNIVWAHRMESAGIHVVYGLVNLKTHCKLCLVVRKESDGIVRYAHVGTGNYNGVTANVYTDFGLFTAKPAVVEEVSEVFNYLTGYSNKQDYRELLVAPLNLRARFTAMVDREAEHARAGRPARIIIKNNSVADPDMIRVSVPRVARRRAHRHDRARRVLPAPRHSRRERQHPRPLHRRTLPRALPPLLLRERRQPRAALRQRGPHGAQSGPARRGAVLRPRPRAAQRAARQRAGDAARGQQPLHGADDRRELPRGREAAGCAGGRRPGRAAPHPRVNPPPTASPPIVA